MADLAASFVETNALRNTYDIAGNVSSVDDCELGSRSNELTSAI